MPTSISGNIVLSLGEGDATVELTGGKGAALSRMAAAGLPVPPGFLISTAAYRQFVAETDPTSWGSAAAVIRLLFEHAAMPVEVATAARRAYAALADVEPAVAVRSSATAEDLPQASFAGQQESFLSVRGEAGLLDAVQRCWASLWTPRALTYRHRLGIQQRAVAMGVVVQVMVPAAVAGVLFTANPSTGERGELLINASFGLGEAVVAGQVTPDTYTVDKASVATRTVALGSKVTMIVPASGDGQGTVARPVPDRRRGERALSDPLLRELAALGMRVERHFGGVPQDVAWAVAGGRCWLLQARPITNLPPAPLRDVRWEPPVLGSKWIRRQVVEYMPEPLSPLFEELYPREGLERSVDAILPVLSVAGLTDHIMDRPLYSRSRRRSITWFSTSATLNQVHQPW